MGYTPSSDTDSYCCPSIRFSKVVCPCFDCDKNTTESSEQPCTFSPTWTIGKYKIYLRDKPEVSVRRILDDRINLRWDEDYLHPKISAKRICNSSMKADTLSEYFQHMMIPGMIQSQKRLRLEDDRDEQQLSNEEEETPKKYPSGRDTFHADERADTISTSSIFTHDLGATNGDGTKELAEMWPLSNAHLRALKALAIATGIYTQLEGATIPLKVVETPLNIAPWHQKHSTGDLSLRHFGRSDTLACIAHFESGSLLLEPDEVGEAFAIASGNSIFVIKALMSDPFENVAAYSVKRIVGNIGRTGICLLVAPVEPKIRSLGNEYNLVEHAIYDGQRENNFKGTSLHLSFSDWTLLLEDKGAEGRTIDQEAYIVESVISVMDSGKWVADLDIICIDFKALTKLRVGHQCPGHPSGNPDYDYTSLDSWEEFLDGPTTVGIFRAHGNWAARLAAVSILSQQGQAHSIGLIGPETFCLECLSSAHGFTPGLKKYESPLPSMCID